MKLVMKKEKSIRIVLLYYIVAVLIRWLYIYLTKDILYRLPYGPSHPHCGIAYNATKDMVSGCFYLFEVAAVLLLRRETKFKDNLLYLFFVLYFMPLNAVSPLVDAGYDFLILSNMFILELVIMLSLHGPGKKLLIIDDGVKEDSLLFDRRIRGVCFVVCVLFIIFKISMRGFQLSIFFSAEGLYENRLSTVKLIGETSTTLMGRITNLIANLATYLAPIYLLISLKQKKLVGIVVAMLTILSQFSLYSMKTTLLYIPIVVAICFYKKKFNLRAILFGGSLAGFTTLTALWVRFSRDSLYYLIVRRTMYVPTWLNTMYYDFFSSHTKLFLTDEVFLLRHILPHIYEERVLKIISRNYFDGLITSPNNGMFAEGFMQFGLLGVLIYPIIYKFMFDWINRVYGNFSEHFQLLIVCIIVTNLPNMGMFRSDFVMSFLLMTAVLQFITKYRIKLRSQKL